MVKVVSTARRADAVRCIGCGINGQLQRGYSCRAQMAMMLNFQIYTNICDEKILDQFLDQIYTNICDEKKNE